MSHVLLENIETGEVVEAPPAGSVPPGFRIKGVVVTKKADPITARLAVWSQKFGLPTADLLDAARWLLNKDCPFCQLGTQVLRRIDELGDEKATSAIVQILEAKKQNDLGRLEQIRQCLDQQELPQRS